MRFSSLARLALPAIALAAAMAASPAGAQQATFSPEQEKAIETLVRDYLIRNPEVLVEAMHALEARQQEQAGAKAKAAIAANAKALFDDGISYVAGNPKGDVTLVEFFDYRCGYCRQVQPSIQALLKEDPKLRVVYKELPVLGPPSVLASRAAIAALRQDKGAKYLAFHDLMMGFRGQLGETEVFRMAAAAGLDPEKLKAGMAKPEVEQLIRANLDLAEKLGINGTPGFVIGNQLVPGAIPLETMRKLVQEARG